MRIETYQQAKLKTQLQIVEMSSEWMTAQKKRRSYQGCTRYVFFMLSMQIIVKQIKQLKQR